MSDLYVSGLFYCLFIASEGICLDLYLDLSAPPEIDPPKISPEADPSDPALDALHGPPAWLQTTLLFSTSAH